MSTRLEKLQKKQAQIKAQIQRALAVERAAEKKENTRRKFLIGDAVLAQMKSGELAEFDLSSVLDRFLTQPNDRALFGLEPLPIASVEKENTDSRVDLSKLPSIAPPAKIKTRAKKSSAAKKKPNVA